MKDARPLLIVERTWTPLPETLREIHGVRGALHLWRIDPARGIVTPGKRTAWRTKGKPVSATRVINTYSTVMTRVMTSSSDERKVALRRLLVAVALTESHGERSAARYEKRLNDWSFGMMQTLTVTAYAFARGLPGCPARTYPADPTPANEKAWREFLQPETSLFCGLAYLDEQDRRLQLGHDPVLLYAAYNAGGVYYSPRHEWGLVTYGPKTYPDQAMDNFVAWYGDACAVYKTLSL